MSIIYTRLTILLLIFLVLDSCRKGDEDPFFSFHSRKDRVAGAWVVSNFNKDQKTTYEYPNNKTLTNSYSQSFGLVNYSETTSDTNGTSIVSTGRISQSSYFFNKSGKWSSVIEYYLYAPQSVGGFYISKSKFVSDGTWAFQGKTDGMKNKESMLLKTEQEKKFYSTYTSYMGTVIDSVADSTITSYTGSEKSEVWKLIGLNTNQMKAEISSEHSFVSSVSGISGTKITQTENTLIELK